MAKKQKGQLKAILRKDLKLVFTWKTITLTVIVPFIMMFLIVGIPTLFVSTADTTIHICTDDAGGQILDSNGTLQTINLGSRTVLELSAYAATIEDITIIEVDTRDDALNASNGIYFPTNYTVATFNDQSVFEFRKSVSEVSIQNYNIETVLNYIGAVVFTVYLELNNVSINDAPETNPIQYYPPTTEVETIWSSETMLLATPFAYALFILLSLVGNMGRTIGFSKEKEDGTFETMLSITKKRSNLVVSKLIVGILSSLLTITSYFAGSVIAGGISAAVIGASGEDYGATGFLSLSFDDLLSYKGVILWLFVGIGLIMTMLALMTVDTLFTKTIAERIGVPVIMTFGLMFLIPVIINPGQASVILYINPYYWIFHVGMSIVDLSFGWKDAIFLVLIIALIVGLVFAARKAIEREKVLFT